MNRFTRPVKLPLLPVEVLEVEGGVETMPASGLSGGIGVELERGGMARRLVSRHRRCLTTTTSETPLLGVRLIGGVLGTATGVGEVELCNEDDEVTSSEERRPLLSSGSSPNWPHSSLANENDLCIIVSCEVESRRTLVLIGAPGLGDTNPGGLGPPELGCIVTAHSPLRHRVDFTMTLIGSQHQHHQWHD